MKKIKYLPSLKAIRTAVIVASLALTSSFYASVACAKVVSDLVAAVVNKNVITKQDVDERFELTLRHIGNQKLSKEQKDQIYRRVLADLINEEIKIQYAQENKIELKSGELNLAIASIEKNNQLPAGSFYKISHGLEVTAKRQIEAEMYWQKIIDTRVRPRISVSNAELDKLILNLIGEAVVEKEVFQIFFAADEGVDATTLKKTVNDFYQKAKNSEVDFNNISKSAKEFGATDAGYLGWFGKGELSKVLDEAIMDMKSGDISPPVRSASGWHILKVGAIRESQNLSLDPIREYKVLRFSLALSTDEKKAKKQIKKFKDEVDNLERLSQIEGLMMKHAEEEAYANSKNFGWIAEEQMSSDVSAVVTTLEKGTFSEPIQENGHISIYYLDNVRDEMPEKLREYRDRMRERIMMNRIELSSRRFMRDLRRRAYIDIRL